MANTGPQRLATPTRRALGRASEVLESGCVSQLPNFFDRFRDYASAGVVHVVLMDPEAFATYVFADGSLIRRELTGFEIPERGFLSFDSREILAQLEEELR